MTREEAIKTLRELWRETNDPWYEEVYNMAIEALEAKTDGDLISRQGAIEAIESNSYGMGSRASVKAIKALPSAEAVEVVRCKDCKYWHSNTEFCDVWSHMNIAQRTLNIDYCSLGKRREDGEA